MHPDHHTDTLAAIRLALLGLLVFGLVGTGVELLLMGHVDGAWQVLPLVLIGVALLVAGWHVADRGAPSIRALQATMIAFMLSGGIGILLHYRGNVEFEVERLPALAGVPLFREAMTGATPPLAPGTMCLLGLLGLTYTFRHPALTARRRVPSPTPRDHPRRSP